MRIGIVAPEFPPDIGGVETYAYEFSTELARRGHDVFVFTLPHVNRGKSAQGFEVLPELKVQYASDRLLPRTYTMDVWHVMNAAYAWLALETQPVVVSVHGNDFINPYFLPKSRPLPHVPGLWRFQSQLDSWPTVLWPRWARRMMWRGLTQARQVIANSQYTRSLLIQRVPRCLAHTSVGYVGVGDDFLHVRRHHCKSDSPKKLVTVCRLAEPRKNVSKVLRALAGLKRHPFEFTVVGDGPVRPKLELLCRQLDLADRVHFTGFISKTEIQQHLASSDLFVLTSGVLPDSIEGFGIVYLEANACGTPVLAARAAGAAEAVVEGKTGFFVDEPSVPAITEALERFLEGDVHFESTDCKAFAKHFTWARVVDHALQYYYPAADKKSLVRRRWKFPIA